MCLPSQFHLVVLDVLVSGWACRAEDNAGGVVDHLLAGDDADTTLFEAEAEPESDPRSEATPSLSELVPSRILVLVGESVTCLTLAETMESISLSSAAEVGMTA